MALLKASDIPEAPGWLKGDALAKWTELWCALERTRVKPELHGDSVAMYCQAYADYRKSLIELEKKGEVVVHQGKVIPHPYVAVKDAAVKQMNELGKALGLEPGKPLLPLRPFSDYTDGDDDDGEAENSTDVLD